MAWKCNYRRAGEEEATKTTDLGGRAPERERQEEEAGEASMGLPSLLCSAACGHLVVVLLLYAAAYHQPSTSTNMPPFPRPTAVELSKR
jgi:hypothetical protein